jgi:hypothetical protein
MNVAGVASDDGALPHGHFSSDNTTADGSLRAVYERPFAQVGMGQRF